MSKFKKGDRYRVIEQSMYFNVGQVVTINDDNENTDCPCVVDEEGNIHAITLGMMIPYNASIDYEIY